MEVFKMMKTKKFLMLSVIVAILFTVANLAMGWTATDPGYDLEYARSDRDVLPQFVAGNTPLTVDGYMVFKQDYDEDGFKLNGETDPVLFTLYPDPMDSEQMLKVWLAYHEGDGKTYVYRWESVGIEVYNFMVKGGENFLVYSYDGTFTWDGHLISPRVGNEDRNIADISHIDIVFRPIPDETEPSETVTEPSETVTEPSETVTESTGPSDETVTETSESVTETTGPADETITDTNLTDESVPLASTTPAGTTIEDEEIPQTGENSNGLLIGLILLGLAGSLTYVMRRSQKQKSK